MTLRRLQLLLDLLNSRVQVIHQVLLLSVLHLPPRLLFLLHVNIFDLFLKVFDLLFVLLDDFLAEMTALSQLFLHFFVVFEVFLKLSNLALHRVVFKHESLCAFRLVV